MQRSEAPDQIDGVNTDDLARRHHRRERVQGEAVVRIVERWYDDDPVGDIEVGVACGQALAIHHNWPREGERHDSKWTVHLTRRVFEAFQVIDRALMIFVAWILFNGHDNRVGAHKPGDIVHMAVRVITHASFAKPDRAGYAKPVGEDALVVGG